MMSYDQIRPYNYVSFRIIQQMANLLQNDEARALYDPIVLNDSDVGDFMIDQYRNNLEEKKRNEQKFWRFDGSRNAD